MIILYLGGSGNCNLKTDNASFSCYEYTVADHTGIGNQ